jgi:CubicO group peptidase (beta-lactamase class C family)
MPPWTSSRTRAASGTPSAEIVRTRNGTLVLGEILQRVTGESVGSLLRARVIEPLGLTSTSYQGGRRMLNADELHGYDVSTEPPVDVYVTFAAGSRDGSRFYVVDWSGVSRDAIHAMDVYLDDLLCR